MEKLALLFSSFAYASLAQDLPPELFLFGTYRDFLPAACLHERDDEGQIIVENAWLGNDNLNEFARCNRLLNADNIWEDAIRNNQISGHPDFEAIGYFTDQDNCNTADPATGLEFPVGSCIFEFNEDGQGFKHSTVGRNLATGENGIPKPQYCDDSQGGETRCGDTADGRQTQTQKKFFDSWYNDDERFNKRVGHKIKLRLGSGNQANQYSFSSVSDESAEGFDDDNVAGFFGPLNMFKIGGTSEVSLSTSIEDAPAWPQSVANDNTVQKRGFWFTSEVHTTFEFRSDAEMTFRFSGDDDFWAFIDGQLTVDVGGMHSEKEKQVDLNEVVQGTTVAELLALESGQVYTLDIFHAERQTGASNFELTTTLFAACNVVQSGTSSFDFIAESKADLDKKFLGRGMAINNDRTISLQRTSDTFSSSFLFSNQEQNVLRGFDATFLAKVSADDTIGFAFVLQSVGLDDFPLVAGESFNIDGLQKSLAVVFDLCVDRGSNDCKEQEVRLHHAARATDGNSPRDGTKRVNDRILRNVKRDEAFPVQIIYFGGRPDFLEVYVNNSLYLRQDNFGQVIEDLELGGAHVGFTATTANLAADITIENFVFNTVQVLPPSTEFSSEPTEELEPLTADGIDLSEGVQIKTFDFCGNQLEAGTLQDFVDAFFIEQRNETGGFFGENPHTERAVVTDNGDGTYQISLRTAIPGNYSLVVAFGEGCTVDFNSDANPSLVVADDDVTCFFDIFDNGNAIVQAFPPDIAPTASPVTLDLDEGGQGPVVLISSIVGGMTVLGIIGAIAFFGFYKKWNRTKGYIEGGNMFRLDMNTAYNADDEYQTTGKKLLDSQKEILSLQAAAKVDGRENEIEKLKVENSEMKAVIKQSKAIAGVNVPQTASTKVKAPKKKAKRTEF